MPAASATEIASVTNVPDQNHAEFHEISEEGATRRRPIKNANRAQPTKATTAAAGYLEDLYTTDAQASGLLVMASYNMGETRLVRLIRTLPGTPSKRNFWAVLQ